MYRIEFKIRFVFSWTVILYKSAKKANFVDSIDNWMEADELIPSEF